MAWRIQCVRRRVLTNVTKHTLLGITGAAACLVAASIYLLSHTQPTSPHTQPETGARYWIITSTALNDITSDQKALATFKNDTIYSPGYNPSSATSAERSLHIIPTESFQSEAQFATDVAAGSIPTYVKAILYDNEPWKLTPYAEQQDPVTYYKQAYTLAHTAGYTLIAAPVPNTLAPDVAPYADIVDVQAQYAQASTSTYLAAVSAPTQQAQQANPHAIILSGLSTNPTAGDPTAQQLYDIAQATFAHLTRGWWLNIPKPGNACPRCNQPRPDIAIRFLDLLGPTRQTAN